ncbi:SPOR domain-containing protein [Rhodohalobacter mucosus]|nr:outer membrane beta-barrel protein [Rhodohalobacter mucosus]
MCKKIQPSLFLITVSLLFSYLLMGVTHSANAQMTESPVRNFSIKLNGGYTFASSGGGTLGPLMGQFDVESNQKSVYGAAIQYAFNPAWSFEAAFNTGSFENQFVDDPAFTTDYLYATFRGVSHLNGLLDLNWAGSRYVNPYFAIGMGLMRSRLSADGLDSEDMSLVLSSSAGALFYLFNGADLFVQYDYNLAGSNLLDGFSGSASSDKFAAVKVGLRFNFGRKGTKLASWSGAPSSRASRSSMLPLPASVATPSPETGIADVNEKAESEMESSSSEPADMAWLTEFGTFMESPAARHPEFVLKSLEFARSMKEARLQAKAMAAEQARLEQERQRLAAAAISPAPAKTKIRRAASPPDGTYIQIGSFPNDTVAEEKWHEVVATLEGVIVNPSNSVFIHEYKQFRRVLIGPFGNASQARTLLSGIQSDYVDAFVIKFPRY